MYRNIITDLLDQEAIITTLAKAKASRRYADRMITLAKRALVAQTNKDKDASIAYSVTAALHARRLTLKFLKSKAVVKKLFDTLAPRYAERAGGYTRILKLQPRLGDTAKLALLELVDAQPVKKGERKSGSTGKSKKTTVGKDTSKVSKSISTTDKASSDIGKGKEKKKELTEPKKRSRSTEKERKKEKEKKE